MATAALRPRSPSELVDNAFQILRAHYTSFVMCTAIAYTPLLILRLALIGDPRALTTDDILRNSTVLTRYEIVLAAGILTYVLMAAVTVTLASQAYLGSVVDVASGVRRVARRLPAVLGAAVLSGLAIFVSFLFFLVPAVYVTARLFAVSSSLLLEDIGVIAAFRRSSELSRGRKRHILSALGLAFIIYFVLIFGATIAASIAGGFVAETVVGTLGVILVYPVVAITNVLLYYDARIQSEGLDLELMVGALTPRQASA